MKFFFFISLFLSSISTLSIANPTWTYYPNVAQGVQFDAQKGPNNRIHLISSSYYQLDLSGTVLVNESQGDAQQGLLSFPPAIAVGDDGSVHIVTRDAGDVKLGVNIRYRKRNSTGNWDTDYIFRTPVPRNYVVGIGWADANNIILSATDASIDGLYGYIHLWQAGTVSASYLGKSNAIWRADADSRIRAKNGLVNLISGNTSTSGAAYISKASAGTGILDRLNASMKIHQAGSARRGFPDLAIDIQDNTHFVYGSDSEVYYNKYDANGQKVFASDKRIFTGLGTWHLNTGLSAIAVSESGSVVVIVALRTKGDQEAANADLLWAYSTDGGVNWSAPQDTGKKSDSGEGRRRPRLVAVGDKFVLLYGDTLASGISMGVLDVLTGSNIAPQANAGADQSVEVNQTITITGSGSDSDGTVVSYEWTKGSTVLANTASFDYTPDTVGTDTLTLTVTDNNGSIGTDSMNVTVTAVPVANRAPIANAGADQSVNTGSTVILDGSGSSDPDGDALTYLWTIISAPAGSTAVLSNDTGISTSFVADVDGSYTFGLEVNDGTLGSTVDTVAITATTLSASFADDFSTDTTGQYATADTWTQGGIGSFTYDSAGARAEVLTGNDVALSFSKDLSGAATEGSFSIDFLPTVFYPSGGVFRLKLIQDATTYYQIENTDNYGAKEIAKYVNGVKVDVQPFSVEYSQGANYTITVNFSPTSTTVEAFGEVLVLNTDTTAVTVNSFSVETTQQDAFYDNIVYSVNQTGSNIAPQANAGADQSVEVNQTITITGSGSDSDGTVVSYEWTKGSTVLANTASFDYTPDTVGTDTLTLTVTDNNGSIGTDSMNVTVTAVPVANRAPIANAGADQSVNTGSTVILDGSGSSDPDGDALTYLWTIISAPAGSTAVLSNDTGISTSFVADVDGSYTFGLEVNDGTLGSTVDTVAITATTLSASFADDFSTDTTGQYATADTWTQGGIGSFTYDSAGARAEVLTGNDVALSFSKDLSGAATEGSFSIDFLPTVFYPSGGVFRLKLIQDATTYYQIENTDNYGAKEIAKYVNGVKVDVQPFSVEYSQGANYTITVNFSPTSTTVEAFGEVLVLNTDTTAVTVNSFSVETTQQDAFYDNIVYSVNQTGSNIAPQANAGADQSVEVNQTITITGSGSDSDGTVVSYEWTKGSTVLANTASFDYTPDTVGTDTLTLTVTDNNGSIGTDSMNVTVTAVPVANRAPIANAGADQSVNTGSTVTLDGSGSSDPDGDALTYLWTIISAPAGSTAVLSNDTGISTSFVADVDGSYTFGLEVNDGTLGSTVDTVAITATTLSASFADDFSTDTTGQYATADTWTQGGIGSFTYDSAGARAEVLTGNDVALSFSKDLSGAATEGSFSIDFLPTVFYPSGGVFRLKLIQDATTYYQIENTDNYGAKEIAKYVNGVKVDVQPFSVEYTQGVNYTITVNFSPTSTTVEAFGEVLVLNTDTTAVTVNSFSVETTQQDAFYDNIVYSVNQTGSNIAPQANAGADQSVEVNQTITITGSGSDSDGTVVSYEWTKGSTVLANTASFDYTPDTVGTDTLTLTVTDNNGSIGTDSMNVTVTAVPVANRAPIANAGADQSVNTGSTVTLDGSGSSDPDGDALTYLWTIISAPAGSTAVLSNDTGISTSFVADVDGSYTFGLEVNDGTLGSTVDTVAITATTLSASFADDFSTDTTGQYATADTWTQGGIGSFTYDSAGARAEVLTGNDVALSFSKDLSGAATEGSFSIDFLPTVFYPSGGVFRLKLIQDATTYYQIENTDNYGAKEIAKYVNGVKVDVQPFSVEYTQGVNYTITVNFSPTSTTVEAFGEVLVLNTDTTAVTVNSFSVETTQQDAFYDNIVYSVSTPANIQLVTPLDNFIQANRDLTVNVLTVDLAAGWGVKFVLDMGTVDEQIMVDMTAPYEVLFMNLQQAEHTINCYIVNELGEEQPGVENHDSAVNVAIGDIFVAVGDSITFGYGDNDITDDVSMDGRNRGGGFEPVLNDYLTGDKGYPHSILNEGVEGENTQEGLLRLPSILSKYPEANTVLLLYGTNNTSPLDLNPIESGKGLNIGDVGYAGTYKDYMQQMIDLVNNAGKKVAIAKIPVVLGTSSSSDYYTLPLTGDEFRNVKTRDFNQALDELISDPSNNILLTAPDLYAYFFYTYDTEYFDNLHPNGLGYRSMSDLWRNSILGQ